MISFLKHIRQRLFLEGKVSRYIGYAIGEIVLVVIGILIALQINDWNTDRTNRALEKQYLKRLLTDLHEDAEIIEFNLDGIDKKKEDLRKVRELLDGVIQLDGVGVRELLNASDNFYNLRGDRLIATFQELVSTGNLQLIRNVPLRDSIVHYYSSWDGQMIRINERRSVYGKHLIHQLVDEEDFFGGNPLMDIESLTDFLEGLGLLNQFMMGFNHEVNYAMHAGKLLIILQNRNQKIVDQIEEELDKL